MGFVGRMPSLNLLYLCHVKVNVDQHGLTPACKARIWNLHTPCRPRLSEQIIMCATKMQIWMTDEGESSAERSGSGVLPDLMGKS